MKLLFLSIARTELFDHFKHRSNMVRDIVKVILWGVLLQSLSAGELEKAKIKELNKIIQTKPDEAAIYLERGELYREDSEYRLALKDFNTAERLNPHLAAIEFARARVYKDINRHDLTEDHLKRFLQLEPENLKALRLLATFYVDRERYQEADAVYGRIIKTFSTPALSFYFLRSQNREAYGDLEGALALIEGAIRLAEWTPMLENKAIEYELKLGDHRAAIERLDRLIERDERRRFRYYQKKAEVFLLMKDTVSAKKNFELALSSLDKRYPRLTHLPGLKTLRDQLLESIDTLD